MLHSPSHTCKCYRLLYIVLFMLSGAESSSKAEIDRHLELGRDFLARGQLQGTQNHLTQENYF